MSQHERCKTDGHDYRPACQPYFKQSGRITGLNLPAHDQSVSYIMLYCTRCGDTLEIVAADHREVTTK